MMPSPRSRPRTAPVLRPLPELTFPELLPVSALRDEIAQAIRVHPVVIVCGETGSGKTTQLPKICAMAGRGQGGLIGHTQPRRLAATSVARRIAEELGSPLGTHVGYKIRFNEKLASGATFKLMTDGILLAETQTDPLLLQYDTLIIDEAHERSLNIDFLLGYLKQLIEGPRRDTLRLVITSATIDGDRFAAHFGRDSRPAPVIEVSGRLYPVEIRYRDPQQFRAGTEDEDDESDLPSSIEAAIDELWGEQAGDVLVFLPGEREIRDVGEHLRRAYSRGASNGTSNGPSGRPGLAQVEILPLFSRLSAADQDRVFRAGNGRRIILATNVAETSLTVPGIRYVVDTGLARIKRYRYRSRVEQLQIEAISQAAANQRSGRCGRVADGVCIRLYSEEDFTARPRFTDPEVLRSSLAAVILRMKSLHLADIEQFPFLDPPPRKAVVDGIELLHELDALDDSQALTETGRALARLPLDPRIGRMLLAARQQGSLQELLVIAAALTCQDPRERPAAQQQAADQQHRRFADEQSDFMSLVKLWNYWRQPPQTGESNRARAHRFEREFLSARKLREWADVHSQLAETVEDMHWRVNSSPATYEQVHMALLAGLLGSLGTRAPDEAQYTGTHGVKFTIHPSSSLTRKSPRWLMAAEWVDTGRLYARNVARIEPQWIERVGAHLIRRTWTDPVWSRNAGQLVAMERGVLYGLAIYHQRRVNHGARDPALSRERLIRDGLIDGDLNADARLGFLEPNRRLIAEIEKLEQKIRRPDLLVNERFLYEWFDGRLPADVWSVESLARWWQQTRAADPNLLVLKKSDLLRKDSEGVDSDAFPKVLVLKGLELELTYHFDPGSSHDGVTLLVPLHVLNQIDEARLEWLVPGMLRDKVAALVKSLPQKIRRHLVPLPEFVEQFCAQAQVQGAGSGSLIDALIAFVQAKVSIRPVAADFKLEQVPQHLFMNLRLIDASGVYLAESRSLAHLKREYGGRAQTAFQSAFAALRGKDGDAARVSPSPVGRSAQQPTATGPGRSDGRPRAPARAAGQADAPAPAPSSAPSGAATLRSGERYVDWSFGELPEILELQTGEAPDAESLIGYPALIDRGEAVELAVFDVPDVATREHRRGLRRLFALALKEPIRFYCRNIADFTGMSLSYARLGSSDELRDELVSGTLERTCMAEPLPTTQAVFIQRVELARPRIGLIGQELARNVALILAEYVAVCKRVPGLRGFANTQRDIEQQLDQLITKDFVTRTPVLQLPHLVRYLKAIGLRIDKLRTDPDRDTLRMREISALQQGYRKLMAQRAGQPDARLAEFGWLLEELRVSLFAQELRTPVPVSVKRLERGWAQLIALA